MPKTDWKIELFSYGEISAERIDFSIDNHYAGNLHFEVLSRIGEEGLDYVIKTPKYKDQRKKD